MSHQPVPCSPTRAVCIVMPARNEAAGLVTVVQEVLNQLSAVRVQGDEVRVLIINDGSTDQTALVIEQLARDHPQVSGVSLSRNFGKEAALDAGIHMALSLEGTQDIERFAIVTMDADGQHPPALLPALMQAWDQGFMVVQAVKVTRGQESRAKGWLARLFYGVLERLTGVVFDQQTDYKLIDRSVARQVADMPERSRFYRGLVAWLGFPSASIPFEVQDRLAGRTQWSGLMLARYAWSNLIAYSSAPLRWIGWMGLLGCLIGLGAAAKALWDYFTGAALDGFSTVILLQILFGSLVLLAIGLLGQYVSAIYDEVKARPRFVIARQHVGQQAAALLRQTSVIKTDSRD